MIKKTLFVCDKVDCIFLHSKELLCDNDILVCESLITEFGEKGQS